MIGAPAESRCPRCGARVDPAPDPIQPTAAICGQCGEMLLIGRSVQLLDRACFVLCTEEEQKWLVYWQLVIRTARRTFSRN